MGQAPTGKRHWLPRAWIALWFAAALVPSASAQDAAPKDAPDDKNADLTLSSAFEGRPVGLPQDNVPRFMEGSFIKDLEGLLAAEQLLKQQRMKAGLTDLTLTLSGKSLPDIRSGGFRVNDGLTDETEEEDFFYLQDASVQKGPIGLTARPDFSSLLAPEGSFRSMADQNGSVTGARVGLALGSEVRPDGTVDPGFLIALESAYQLSAGATNWSDYGGFADQLADRRYNVGVTLGYSGFNLDAAMRREWSPTEIESVGYDLGFSYQSTGWSARLGWSAYKSGEDLKGLNNEARSFVSVELGANLNLSDRFGLLGGLKYYAYEDFHILNTGQDTNQMVFLGGRMRF